MHEDTKRHIALAAAVALIVGAIVVLENWGTRSVVPSPPADLPASETGLTGAAGFEGATGWLNTPDEAPLDIVSLRGKVVLVDFWTYSCINCIRTLPHVTRLYDTYHDHGLVVVGVHTPEFGFERDRDNVARAIADRGIHYPVPQDNDFSIWTAYHNRYWPAHYLIDQYGKIRATHFGEGAYAETEAQVRELLVEAGAKGSDLPAPFEDDNEGGDGPHTGELYAAGERSVVGNPEGYEAARDTTYARPPSDAMERDTIYLVGTWRGTEESVTALGAGFILLTFQAGAGNVVLDGAAGCLPLTFDGAAVPAALAGPDVDVAGSCLRVDGADSYDFYAGPNGSHTVELQAPAGLALYTFDFGGAV